MMQRGDIVLCCVKGPYSGKPRPAVVVQSNEVSANFQSVTLCPITSCSVVNADSFRVAITPGKINQLKKPSFVMVDKIGTYPRSSLRLTAGTLSKAVMKKLDVALQGWLQL